MEKLSHIDDLKRALDDFAFHQKTSKSTKSINYFATAQYSLGGSGVYREFCFFSIYTGLIWKRLLICSDAWAENIPGGEYDLVKLPLPGSCGRVSFFYSEAL